MHHRLILRTQRTQLKTTFIPLQKLTHSVAHPNADTRTPTAN